MPHRNPSRRFLTRVVLFSLAGWALVALSRARENDLGGVAETPAREPAPALVEAETVDAGRSTRKARARWSRRRVATSLAFVTLFFAGASLSAIAGDELVQATSTDPAAATDTSGDTSTDVTTTDATTTDVSTDGDTSTDATGDTTTDVTTTDVTTTDVTTTDETTTDSTGDGSSSGDQGGSQGDQGGSGQGSGDGSSAGSSGGSSGDSGASDGGSRAKNSAGPVLLPPSPAQTAGDGQALDPEVNDPNAFATVWLHRTLPDPTPPAKRLAPAFAHDLASAAKNAGVDWAFALAVLRAEGRDGRWPATPAQLRELGRRLAEAGASQSEWSAALAYSGRTAFADRVRALTWYNRAVGLSGLVNGLEAEKKALEGRLLSDPRVNIYPGGIGDVSSGRVDVRVLVMIEYLANAFHEVTVSCLITGHRLYARPGVVSAHIYGLAADIAALGGVPIYGHQNPGGLTEQAVRDILLVPAELRPQQVISLLGLGGPSFALADHYDHIHIGY